MYPPQKQPKPKHIFHSYTLRVLFALLTVWMGTGSAYLGPTGTPAFLKLCLGAQLINL